MSCRLPPWHQSSLKTNIFYVTAYDQYSNYKLVTIIAHMPWIAPSFGSYQGSRIVWVVKRKMDDKPSRRDEENPAEDSAGPKKALGTPNAKSIASTDLLSKEGTAGSFKMILLVLMVAQNSALALVGRYTRSSVPEEDLYVVNHIVMVCEAVKLTLALCLENYASGGRLFGSIHEHIISNPTDFFKILIPSLLYLVQNSLLFVALSNLPAPLYQVTYQGKLLTTALVSVSMLQRRYKPRQWVCLLTLGLGVAIVVLGESSGKGAAATAETGGSHHQNMIEGLIAVTVACFCSAFAGVYTEKLLKKPMTIDAGSGNARPPASLWMRNIQMAFFSVIIALVNGTRLNEKDAEKPFLHGFTHWVWALVWIQAAGGLLVAAVMKYADNVLKGLATGVSVVLATAFSSVFLGTNITNEFAGGAAIVLGSVYFFSNEFPKILQSRGANETVAAINDKEIQPLTSKN